MYSKLLMYVGLEVVEFNDYVKLLREFFGNRANENDTFYALN